MGGVCKFGFDCYNVYVQLDGIYYYYGILIGVLVFEGGLFILVFIGYVVDGFLIYGFYGYFNLQQKLGMKKFNSSYWIKSGMWFGGLGGCYNGKFM